MKLMQFSCATLLMLALFGAAGCGNSGGSPPSSDAGHAEGDGHDHDAESGAHVEHEEEGYADEGDHDEHSEEIVRLTPAQLERAGVVISPLSGGVITTHITLPAEVGLNLDTVVHVTPRVPGIVTEVLAFLGDEVSVGAPLAVIESPELGEAKIMYLQAIQTMAIADAELSRQQTISKNTATLLDLLKNEDELDELRSKTSDLRIGENKGRLLSAYAKLRAAQANYARERDLRTSNLSTEADLLAAQEAFNSSQADYLAAFEDIEFTYRLKLQEAERRASVATSSVDNAERRLHLLGLSEEQVKNIADEPDRYVARYELRAPTSGRLVDKHITPGEKLGDEESVYTIANLDTVWLNVSVYSEYARLISEGQSVVVHADNRTTNGVVDYISAVVSEGTRTLSARVVIENFDRSWKPGEFVTARVETSETPVARIVPIEAIQTYEGREVVFVQRDDGIAPTPVKLGRRNDVSVELIGEDIPLGALVVVKNSFLMKAELGKSAAGHDH